MFPLQQDFSDLIKGVGGCENEVLIASALFTTNVNNMFAKKMVLPAVSWSQHLQLLIGDRLGNTPGNRTEIKLPGDTAIYSLIVGDCTFLKMLPPFPAYYNPPVYDFGSQK